MKSSTDLGLALAAEGISLAALAQEQVELGWGDRALAAVRRVTEDHEFVTADLVRDHFTEEPEHRNAWGAVWKKAVKRCWLVEELGVPRPHSTRPIAHAKRQTLYRSTIWHGW